MVKRLCHTFTARFDSVTGSSDFVTADSDKPRNSVTTISERPVTPSESPVTLFRNQRSRCLGIRTKLNYARAETVDTKPSFRTSFAKHRCLIPANGFYEWKLVSEGGKVRRQPYYVRPAEEDGFFAFAGLLARWRAPDGSDLVSTCIITTAANTLMAGIHDRMPVILGQQAWGAWLTPENASMEALKGLLVPCAADGIVAYPVSTAVNRAGLEGEALITPMAK